MTNLKPAHCYEMVRCTSANMNKNCLPSFSWDLRNKASSLIVVKRASRNRKHFGQREKLVFFFVHTFALEFLSAAFTTLDRHILTLPSTHFCLPLWSNGVDALDSWPLSLSYVARCRQSQFLVEVACLREKDKNDVLCSRMWLSTQSAQTFRPQCVSSHQ